MISASEAFDILCDKIKSREYFTGELVARASGCSPKGYLLLEAWVLQQDYRTVIYRSVVTYHSKRSDTSVSRIKDFIV